MEKATAKQQEKAHPKVKLCQTGVFVTLTRELEIEAVAEEMRRSEDLAAEHVNRDDSREDEPQSTEQVEEKQEGVPEQSLNNSQTN